MLIRVEVFFASIGFGSSSSYDITLVIELGGSARVHFTKQSVKDVSWSCILGMLLFFFLSLSPSLCLLVYYSCVLIQFDVYSCCCRNQSAYPFCAAAARTAQPIRLPFAVVVALKLLRPCHSSQRLDRIASNQSYYKFYLMWWGWGGGGLFKKKRKEKEMCCFEFRRESPQTKTKRTVRSHYGVKQKRPTIRGGPQLAEALRWAVSATGRTVCVRSASAQQRPLSA